MLDENKVHDFIDQPAAAGDGGQSPEDPPLLKFAEARAGWIPLGAHGPWSYLLLRTPSSLLPCRFFLKHAGQGNRFEFFDKGFLKFQCYFAQPAGFDARANFGPKDAVGQCYRSLEYFYQLCEIDLFRGSGQGKAAPLALKRDEDASGVKCLQDGP